MPWELITGADGHIAADAVLRYAPLRRLGLQRDPPPPDAYCLGLAFMAAAPRGPADVLDYEGEENAILKATGTLPIDLVVEESGNPDLLAERLAELEAMQVLHLSCHGHSEPAPVLLLEDEEGGPLPTGPAALIEALGAHLPRLAFVSACLSAAVGSLADPLAMTLVRAGVPSVLGWDGSVRDREAIAFAHALYRNLAARRQSVEEAVAAARRELLNAETPEQRGDWHLARLWLGPAGGGVLVGGRRQRRRLGKDHGHKQFLDKHGERPVASRQAFVGRRRELQEGLKVLREGSGLLIHGMGRLGKSSLAARLAHRRAHDLIPVVIFGRYDAVTIADGIRTACPAARAAVDAARPHLRDAPGGLEDLLRDILEGPCAQTGGGSPVLLVVDDLERILETPTEAGPWRVKPAFQPVMRAVLRAFDRADTDSRLLLTSRFTFTLPDGGVDLATHLHALHLPPMDDAGRRKQALRRLQAENREAVVADEERRGILDRCVAAAHGSPGLQDLLFGLALENPQAAEGELAAMETYLQGGELPGQEAAGRQVRDFLENLDLDSLLALAGESGRALLKAATLFQLPVPLAAVTALADAVGGNPDRLWALGLIDRFEDLVDPHRPAFMVNALVAPKLGELNQTEMAARAGQILAPLFAAWGGGDEESRPAVADVELTRLALLCGDPKVIAASAPKALAWLDRQFAYPRAAAWGEEAIAILDAADTEPSLALLRRAGEALLQCGDAEAARTCYDRALKIVTNNAAAVAPFEYGALQLAQARLLAQQGEWDAALALFEQVRSHEAARGNETNVAVVQGEIADILHARGDLNEALRIRTEEQLPVYERLGDVRSKAVTMAQIADILFARGDLDEALRTLREEALPAFERLGDVREKAVTVSKIADILHARGDLDEALRIRTEEQLPVYERLGDVRSKAVTMAQIADILFARGDLDEALLNLREEALPAFERLGDARSKAATMGKIADILYRRGDLDKALRTLREEALPVYERLGDVRSKAVTMGKIADILHARGDLDEALRIRTEEEILVYERLGDVREKAVTMGKIADILHVRGDLDEALLTLREEALPAFERLGDVREKAVTMGQIADILYRRGDLDEALRIRTEEQLPVYERLGDIREKAVTMGKIADILHARGDLDEALRIRTEEQLPVYERLGDIREKAVTMAQIADILFARGDLDEALLTLREEALPAFERLGDARSKAATMGKIADILYRRGDFDKALRTLREEALPVYERLGDIREKAVTMAQIADILFARGDLDEALLTLREEALPAFERLGDVRSKAAALWKMSQIAQVREDWQTAAPLVAQSYQIFQDLGDAEGLAVVGEDFGKLLLDAGEQETGLAVLWRAEEAYRKLGRDAEADRIGEIIAANAAAGAEEGGPR